eukprot:scaffold123816_cov82-Phaeocystis_antarctica.AAC.3
MRCPRRWRRTASPWRATCGGSTRLSPGYRRAEDRGRPRERPVCVAACCWRPPPLRFASRGWRARSGRAVAQPLIGTEGVASSRRSARPSPPESDRADGRSVEVTGKKFRSRAKSERNGQNAARNGQKSRARKESSRPAFQTRGATSKLPSTLAAESYRLPRLGSARSSGPPRAPCADTGPAAIASRPRRRRHRTLRASPCRRAPIVRAW